MNGRAFIVLMYIAVFSLTLGWGQSAFAQAKGHASVGLGHGEEGYLQLEEMIKHIEFSLKMPDANSDLRSHGEQALKDARAALDKYNDALKHASEALGRPARTSSMGEGSGGGMPSYREEGSNHSHEEGSNRRR